LNAQVLESPAESRLKETASLRARYRSPADGTTTTLEAVRLPKGDQWVYMRFVWQVRAKVSDYAGFSLQQRESQFLSSITGLEQVSSLKIDRSPATMTPPPTPTTPKTKTPSPTPEKQPFSLKTPLAKIPAHLAIFPWRTPEFWLIVHLGNDALKPIVLASLIDRKLWTIRESVRLGELSGAANAVFDVDQSQLIVLSGAATDQRYDPDRFQDRQAEVKLYSLAGLGTEPAASPSTPLAPKRQVGFQGHGRSLQPIPGTKDLLLVEVVSDAGGLPQVNLHEEPRSLVHRLHGSTLKTLNTVEVPAVLRDAVAQPSGEWVVLTEVVGNVPGVTPKFIPPPVLPQDLQPSGKSAPGSDAQGQPPKSRDGQGRKAGRKSIPEVRFLKTENWMIPRSVPLPTSLAEPIWIDPSTVLAAELKPGRPQLMQIPFQGTPSPVPGLLGLPVAGRMTWDPQSRQIALTGRVFPPGVALYRWVGKEVPPLRLIAHEMSAGIAGPLTGHATFLEGGKFLVLGCGAVYQCLP